MNEIKLGQIYKRKHDEFLVNVIPDYIVISRIKDPDSILDYTRYYFYDVERGQEARTYFTYDDIEGMYQLVET